MPKRISDILCLELESRYAGGHAMTKERYDDIMGWIVMNVKS